MKREVTYVRPDGSPFTVEYDSEDPCVWCGLPVIAASMSGTACCSWCDLGICRFDKSHRVDREAMNPETGKMYPPRTHYEREHPDRLEARATGEDGA